MENTLVCTDAAPLVRSETNPAVVYLASLQEGGRRGMRVSLNRAAGILSLGMETDGIRFDWTQIRYAHVAFLRAELQKASAPNTANHVLASVKGTLKEAWRMGALSDGDWLRVRDVGSVRGSRLPSGRALSNDEMGALFGSCDMNTAGGVRDSALLAVLFAGGLRRDEVMQLNAGDMDTDTGELRVLHAKGGKQRVLFLANGALRAVQAWVRLRGTKPGPLFLAVNKGGRVRQDERMTAQAVYNIIVRATRRSGGKHLSPHDARRTLATTLEENGTPITVIQSILGHASVSTTARYSRLSEKAKRRAAETLSTPFVEVQR